MGNSITVQLEASLSNLTCAPFSATVNVHLHLHQRHHCDCCRDLTTTIRQNNMIIYIKGLLRAHRGIIFFFFKRRWVKLHHWQRDWVKKKKALHSPWPTFPSVLLTVRLQLFSVERYRLLRKTIIFHEPSRRTLFCGMYGNSLWTEKHFNCPKTRELDGAGGMEGWGVGG